MSATSLHQEGFRPTARWAGGQASEDWTSRHPNGVAIGCGYLVSVLGDDSTMICHMADTGKEVWRYRLANHNALGITIAPLIHDHYVIVSTEPGGNSRATYEGGAAGIVYFLDLAISTMLWTFDTTKDQF